MSVNFDDTKITFQSKSPWELKVSKFIFSVLNRPFFVFLGTSIIKWAFQFRLPIKGLIKATLLINFVEEKIYKVVKIKLINSKNLMLKLF